MTVYAERGRRSAAALSKAEGDRIAEGVLKLCQALADVTAPAPSEPPRLLSPAEHARLAERDGWIPADRVREAG